MQHGHQGMLPTGYTTRDIKVTKGVDVVRKGVGSTKAWGTERADPPDPQLGMFG